MRGELLAKAISCPHFQEAGGFFNSARPEMGNGKGDKSRSAPWGVWGVRAHDGVDPPDIGLWLYRGREEGEGDG